MQLFIYDFIPAVFVNLLCSDRVELAPHSDRVELDERELAGVSPSPPPGLSSLTASMDRTTTEISIGLTIVHPAPLLVLHCSQATFII